MDIATIFITFVNDHAFIGVLVIALGLIWLWVYIFNPYSRRNFVQQPYTTDIKDGQITYTQHFTLQVYANPLADFIGYLKHGVLIVHNTFFGGKPLTGTTSDEIIAKIHTIRFNTQYAYLISGDQFSVLYPRNLGVFYNQLLDPNTAHDNEDWLSRQQLYIQSVLYAIDGLSVGVVPKTTLIPISPRAIVTTRVHPGDIASDAVYGVLFALSALLSQKTSADGSYTLQTQTAAKRIIKEKRGPLVHMIESYLHAVRDPKTLLIRTDIKLASARDGVTRSSSLYDNIVLWKTLSLARELDIYTDHTDLQQLRKKIDDAFWNEKLGYYQNDRTDTSFSSDWLIGYVTGFFQLENQTDLARAQKIVEYIEHHKLASPLPIKYQLGEAQRMPFIIRLIVPSYGSTAIWSYWGAQYITLLADVYRMTNENRYATLARTHIAAYEKAIVRDGGFAEMYTPDGKFLRTLLYKSIRVTGWVVQYEHAKKKLGL